MGAENCRWHSAGMQGKIDRYNARPFAHLYPMDEETRYYFDSIGAPRAAAVEFPDGCIAILESLTDAFQASRWGILASPRPYA